MLLINGAGELKYENPTSVTRSSATITLNGIYHEPFCITHKGKSSTVSSGISYLYADAFGYIKDGDTISTNLSRYYAKSGSSGTQETKSTNNITVTYNASEHTVTIVADTNLWVAPTIPEDWHCFYV